MEFRGMDFKIALEHQNTDGFQVKHKHFRGKKNFLKYQEKVEKSIHK